jgi:hypothetical protein
MIFFGGGPDNPAHVFSKTVGLRPNARVKKVGSETQLQKKAGQLPGPPNV